MTPKPIILIVDDSPTMAKINQNTVESFGNYEVVIRENSTRAISYLGNNKVDLILMDIELADSKFDGIETARLIMSKYQIPIVFVTSIETPEIFRKAQLPSFFAVLLKPYDARMMRTQIEVALQNNSTEIKYRESDQFLDSYIANSPNGIIICNSSGKIVKMNEVAEQICDYSRQLTINKPILDIMPLAIDDGKSGQFILSFDELVNKIDTKQFLLNRDGKSFRLKISKKILSEANIVKGYAIEFGY